MSRMTQFVLRVAVAALCGVALVLFVATTAAADITIYSDGWSEENMEASNNYFFTTGISEGEYYDTTGVELLIYDPGWAFINYQSDFGGSYSRADVTQFTAMEVEGEYSIETDHWGNEGFLGALWFGVGSAKVATRHAYSHKYWDSLGRVYYVYYPYLCNNSCEATFIVRGPNPLDSPPLGYYTSAGTMWSIFGISWCRLTGHAVAAPQWTQCFGP